jgi:hypothetical protein
VLPLRCSRSEAFLGVILGRGFSLWRDSAPNLNGSKSYASDEHSIKFLPRKPRLLNTIVSDAQHAN